MTLTTTVLTLTLTGLSADSALGSGKRTAPIGLAVAILACVALASSVLAAARLVDAS